MVAIVALMRKIIVIANAKIRDCLNGVVRVVEEVDVEKVTKKAVKKVANKVSKAAKALGSAHSEQSA